MTRSKIISGILDRCARARRLDAERAKFGQEHPKKPVPGIAKDIALIRAELAGRLTQKEYFTCTDFDHFDAGCCETCHDCYPHYEMRDVVLSDGRHAWVCHAVEHILMRETEIPWIDPRMEEILKSIFGDRPDPVRDAIDSAFKAASTDVEKLKHCLRYAHHIYGRKRGDEPLDSIVAKALELPGGEPAQGVHYAGRKFRSRTIVGA